MNFDEKSAILFSFLMPTKPSFIIFFFFAIANKNRRSFLRKFRFDYLVVDEGHTLKNPKGSRYRNLDKFVTSHRLLLTGEIRSLLVLELAYVI